MNQEQAGLIMVGLMVIALGLALWGWRNRKNRYGSLTQALTWAKPAENPSYASLALYVATTEADKPLQRVAAGVLAYRSKVSISVSGAGVSVSFPGNKTILIPATAGLDVGTATWTIDRVVEPGGLVMLRWMLGGLEVDSYFRLVDGNADEFMGSVSAVAKGAL
jgi:uncharacterized membrane protein